ncbi:Protein of uncharacterised function (DUF3024) [Actinomyces bovis]|uniref:Protein of uncharacterized function (DUF3024) n=1 Tax=Actinomyces bovis TaxID=1658 RepID=A0ABY1VR73_9ACTO|nr:DUF3024 domain-containing protein [Actinomyces bovis]SPT54338.1 Protein of uncharacterised function (DUF3024) [Actinomyces bovis]VEG56267.1 Protein of uncharacterised function (DUF3024) [Actinomyces israelii]
MALPEAALETIRHWCRTSRPEQLRDCLCLELKTTNIHATIFKVSPGPAGEPVRRPVARLRYVKYARMWTLYWPDQRGRFHEHRHAPTPDVRTLLDYLASCADPIFCG